MVGFLINAFWPFMQQKSSFLLYNIFCVLLGCFCQKALFRDIFLIGTNDKEMFDVCCISVTYNRLKDALITVEDNILSYVNYIFFGPEMPQV